MAKIYYFALADEMRKEDKLNWLRDNPLSKIPFETIKPDKNNNWLNIMDNDFESLLPLISKEKSENTVFDSFSNGISTNRDEWVYDKNLETLKKKVAFFQIQYNQSIKTKFFNDTIKWSRDLKAKLDRKQELKTNEILFIKGNYRPFSKEWLALNPLLNDVISLNKNYFNDKNYAICLNANGSDSKTLAIDSYPDLHFIGDTKCLPLSIYNKNGERKDNITDWALAQFQNHYQNESITKENIFYYVYAVLHTPQYRVKYEQNLKRDFPRIPFYKDFMFFAERGKELANLHIGYEAVDKYPLETVSTKKSKDKPQGSMLFEEPEPDLYAKAERNQYIPKAKLKANKENGEIELDDVTILRGIPAEAWEYKLGNRSALEWILDQYKESKPTDKTIAEHFNTYRFADYKEVVVNLLMRVCRVSMETVRIVKELEQANS